MVEDAKREKGPFEYLFLDIEWNQAPGTSGLDGREAIQIGVVAADAQIQKVKTFSKAIRLSDPKVFNEETEIISHSTIAHVMRGNEEKAVLEKFAQSFPQYCHLIVWRRDSQQYFIAQNEHGCWIYVNDELMHEERNFVPDKTPKKPSSGSTSSHYPSDPYDVEDYNDPDDFAEEWAEKFGDGSYDDGYDDAYDYWESERD